MERPPRVRKLDMSSLKNKFEAPEVREARRKLEAEEVQRLLELEKVKRAQADEERQALELRRKHDEAERLERERIQMEQRLEHERLEEEEARRKEDSQKRIGERRKQMEEEEEKLLTLKPAQALFMRQQQNLNFPHEKCTKAPKPERKMLSNQGAVGDMQRRLMNKAKEARDFEKELKDMTDQAIREAHLEENKATKVIAKKSRSSVELYTKGTCSNLKSAFESQSKAKQERMSTFEENPPIPSARRKSAQQRIGPPSGTLPDMFQQQAKRNKELEEQRGVKDRIPMNKKIFSNSMNKFEDEDSRKRAKVELTKFTFKQKERDKALWVRRQEEEKKKRKEEEVRRREEELEQERKRQHEEAQRKVQEEFHRTKLEEEESVKKSSLKQRKSTKRINRKELKAIMEPKELPKIIPPTASTMKQKIQENMDKAKTGPKHTPSQARIVGKLTISLFQRQDSQDSSTVTSPISPGDNNKPLVIPEVQRNPVSDIRKKFKQVIGVEKIPISKNVIPPKAHCDEMEEESVEILTDSTPDSAKVMEAEYPIPSKNEIPVPKQKKSKEEMQNYLIAKVLFDDLGNQTKKPKDSVEELIVDEEPSVLDPEYVKEMEKYINLIDRQPKKRDRKNKENRLKKEAEKLKIFEVKNIKNQFEMKRQQSLTLQRSVSKDKPSLSPIDAKVDKFKTVFEGGPDAKVVAPRPQPRRKTISNDLLNKFDDPEVAEKLRTKREEEREQRRLQRLAKLEEDRKRQEEDLKEAKRLELARLEAERLELLKSEEAERARKANEERKCKILERAFAEERARIEERRMKAEDAKTKKEKEERLKNKNKVLHRISHIFEKNDEPPEINRTETMGSIRGMAEELFMPKRPQEEPKGADFKDPCLTGVSSVLTRVKRQLEQKEEKPTISRGVEKRKSLIPAALAFEIQGQLDSSKRELQESRVKSPNAEETKWAWKTKSPEELLVRSSSAKPPERMSQRPEKPKPNEEKQRLLLDDIHKVTARLKVKDAEKEHEEKMKEYELFMADIQDYLNEPAEDIDEADYKHDIQEYLEYRFSTPSKPKPKAKAPNLILTNVSQVKSKLENKRRLAKSKAPIGHSKSIGNVKELQQMLLEQESGGFEKRANNLENVVSSINLDRAKNAFEGTKAKVEQPKVRVMKKIIEMPQVEPLKADDIPKPSYQWKYKQRNIGELQKFLDTNAHLVPSNMADKLEEVRSNLDEENEDDFDKTEELKIDEYTEFLDEVDKFLTAPDRSRTEVDFKSEIEKYLDLIEEARPRNRPQLDGSSSTLERSRSVKRKPKKINLREFTPINQADQSRHSPSPQRDNKLVAQLQSKLIQEFEKSDSKCGVHLPSVQTNTLKNTFEKLINKEEEPTLLGARTIVLQRGLDELTGNSESMSLETLKSEREKIRWQWKEKQVQDLRDFIKAKEKSMPEEIRIKTDQHEAIEKQRELREIQAKAENNVDEIRRIMEEKEKDFETFIGEVKDCLSADPDQDEEEEVKSGLGSYVKRFENEPQSKREQYKRPRPKSMVVGDISMRRELLKHQMREDMSSDANRSGEIWQVGKVDTSPFIKATDEGEDEGDDKDMDDDRSIRRTTSVTSARREALENAFSQQQDVKEPLMKIRKPRKLIETSMFEMKVNETRPTLTPKAATDWKWKKKNIQELQSFMNKNDTYISPTSKILQSERMRKDHSKAEIAEDYSKERVEQEAEESECFLNEVNDYLTSMNTSAHEDRFKETIQIYLELIENNDRYSAPKEPSRRFNESQERVTNLKNSIIEQQRDKKKRIQQSRSVGKLNLDFDPLEPESNFEKLPRPVPQEGKICGLIKQKLERDESFDETKPLRKAPKAKIVNDTLQPAGVHKKKPTKTWSRKVDKTAPSTQAFKSSPKKWAYKEKEAAQKAALLKHHSDGSDEDNVSINIDLEDYDIPAGVLQSLPKEYITIEERGERLTTQDEGSFGTLRNIMGLMKKGQVNQAFKQSKQMFASQEKGLNKVDHSPLQERSSQALCSNIRNMFETGEAFQGDETDFPPGMKAAVPKSKSCANMRARFEEQGGESPIPTKRIPREVMSSSRRVRDARKSLVDPGELRHVSQFSLGEDERPGESQLSLKQRYEHKLNSGGWSGSTDSLVGEGQQRLIHKSSSFNKFRDAFEAGKVENLHPDEDDELPEPRSSGIKAELEALRSCDRIQKIMRINKPRQALDGNRSSLSRSKTTTCIDLDEETLEEVSRSKSAIRNMFESQGPKIRFGGHGIKPDSGVKKSNSGGSDSSSGGRANKPKYRGHTQEKEQFKERKWVFDTINKYFDVIKEDEEDDEDEDETTNLSSTFSSQMSLNSPALSPNVSVGPHPGGFFHQYSPSPSGSSLQVPPERPSFTPGMRNEASIEELPGSSQPPSPPSRRSSLRKNLQSSPYQLRGSKSFGPESNPYMRSSNTSLSSVGSTTSLNQSISRSPSSNKLRGMLEHVMRSKPDLNLGVFKQNLRAHLASQSQDDLSETCQPTQQEQNFVNRDPGVSDSPDPELMETDRYFVVPL